MTDTIDIIEVTHTRYLPGPIAGCKLTGEALTADEARRWAQNMGAALDNLNEIEKALNEALSIGRD